MSGRRAREGKRYSLVPPLEEILAECSLLRVVEELHEAVIEDDTVIVGIVLVECLQRP